MWNGHWSIEEIEKHVPNVTAMLNSFHSRKWKSAFHSPPVPPYLVKRFCSFRGFFPAAEISWSRISCSGFTWNKLGFLLDKCEMDGTTTTTTTTTTTLTITATTTYFIFTLEGMDSDINKLEIQKKIWNNMNPSHGVKPVQLILSPSNSEMSIVSLVVVCNQCCQGKITHYYK